MVSDERALAILLASTDDDALARTFAAARRLRRRRVARLLRRRRGPARSGIGRTGDRTAPPHGSGLPRRRPERLVRRRADRGMLLPLALVGERWRPLRRGRRAGASSRRCTRPDAFEPAPEALPVTPADDADAAAAAERAFTTVGALADVLLAGLHTPLSRTGTGAVSAVDRRRLTDAGVVASAEDIDDLVAAAEAADLVTPVGREWIVTDAGLQWLEATTTRRWSAVAVGLREGLPPGLRTTGGGFRPPAELGRRLPPAPGLDRPGRTAATASRRCGGCSRRPAPSRHGRPLFVPAGSPTPTPCRFIFPPRSTACTCRPTSLPSHPVRSRPRSICGCAPSRSASRGRRHPRIGSARSRWVQA